MVVSIPEISCANSWRSMSGELPGLGSENTNGYEGIVYGSEVSLEPMECDDCGAHFALDFGSGLRRPPNASSSNPSLSAITFVIWCL